MVIGVGTDIVSNQRIAQLFAKQGLRFAQRILSVAELEQFAQHHAPERLLAKRWALKESVAKALGTGFSQGVSFTDMSVGYHDSGQPYLQLQGKTLAIAQAKGINDWQISISDEQDYSIAFAMAQSI